VSALTQLPDAAEGVSQHHDKSMQNVRGQQL
jgi:hypothetical protein